jgi:hypothetical protein
VAELGETAQFLDVEMEQIAGCGMFVALHRRRGFEIAEAIESEPAQDAADGSGAEPGMGGNAATGPALAPQVFDLLYQLQRGGLAQAMRPRAAVTQAGGIGLITAHPLAGGLGADFELGCSRVQSQPLENSFG